ncbi:hypothetical protein AMTR_s00008p00179920 [Amborella trichopoda]|uniref:Protein DETOXIFICATION n=1 Tax=Amborella trichopoda TaxID=13333 RepID=W1NJJ9_AMBTC|nr:hypothetical protein AMTR_s00008p00179920 [Amborella trichopoda]
MAELVEEKVGHLGDLQLSAISIASTVVVGFNFGILLGMASALETLCGQVFGARKYHMLGVPNSRDRGARWLCHDMVYPPTLCLCFPLSSSKIPPKPLEEYDNCVRSRRFIAATCWAVLGTDFRAEARARRGSLDLEFRAVGAGDRSVCICLLRLVPPDMDRVLKGGLLGPLGVS